MARIKTFTPCDARLMSILLIYCCVLFVDQCQSQGLTVVGPRIIRIGKEFKIVFVNTYSKPDSNLRLEVVLTGNTSESVIFRKPVTVARTTSLVNTYFVNENQASDVYSLSIRSMDSNFVFDKTINLVCEKKSMSVQIQTDKPIYKPGDIIRFRVIVTDIDTRPKKFVEEMHVELHDSKGNSITEWRYIKLFHGVFQSAVQLAPSVNIGNWTLTVTSREGQIDKKIELREYVLPKFSVVVSAPNVLIANLNKLDIKIEAFYTFGLQLNGTAKIEIYSSLTIRKPDYTFNKNLVGYTDVHVDLHRPIYIDSYSNSALIKVVATVIEAYSNNNVSVTEYIPVFRNPYSVTVSRQSQPKFYPGLPFDFDVTVTDHYGVPVVDGDVRIDVECFEDESNRLDTTRSLNPNGSFPIYFTPSKECGSITVKAKFDSVDYDQIAYIHAAESQSHQYLQISRSPRYPIAARAECVFTITCTEKMHMITYVITARGMIVKSSSVRIPNRNKHDIRIKLEDEMAPNATLLVFYNRGSYVIFDDYPLNFDVFNNDLKVSIDNDVYLPGQAIYVDVEAASDSYIFTQIIDHSALLLGWENNNFLEHHARQDLVNYLQRDLFEFDYFSALGLFVQTNALLDSALSKTRRRRSTIMIRQVKALVNAVRYRTDFPESWMWKNYSMNRRTDFMQIAENIPDTITSWQLSVFALSPSYGLGVMKQPVTFTVKQDFFIVVHLPYSIKRDEVTNVRITVFNFIGNDVTTDVKVYNKRGDFEFVDQNTDQTFRSKAVYVPTDSGVPINFMIKAKKLGDIVIRVEAYNLLKADAVEHILRVVPASLLYENNEARFIELSHFDTRTFHIVLNIPRYIDEGSEKIMFSVEGDIFRTTMQNLGSLIRLPTGCGEQNMVNFVPNIVILDYLSEAGIGTDSDKTTARNYLASGYQNQLKYRRSDGSFSVWGGSDSKGSTFLTAFVAKSFKIADKYMYIDRSVTESAFSWLARNQNSNGQFTEVGRIIHADMQGGLRSSSYALTAYVLAAFLENPDMVSTHRDVVHKSLKYLSDNFDYMSDVYDLAITTYAFSMSDHPKKEGFFSKLIEKSVLNTTTTMRYWNRGARSVEVAGYALLSYVARGSIIDASPIMHWLNSQRFALGGFPGTQDTFVGLKALSKYAAKASSNRNDYSIKLLSKPVLRTTVFVTKENSMNIQQTAIDSSVRSVNVEVKGTGTGIFQIQYQYYVNLMSQPAAKQAFKISLSLLNTTTYYVQHLHICVAYQPPEAYPISDMALVEIYFPSGILASADSVKDLSTPPQIRKTELRQGDTNVVVYYDNLGSIKQCFEVTAYRRFRVALHRPSYVKAYDYYDPKKFGIVQYEGKVMNLCDICEDEDCESLSC